MNQDEDIIKLFAEDDLPEWCAREFINFGADTVRRLAQITKEEINAVIENSPTKTQWKPLWIRSTVPDIIEQAKLLSSPLPIMSPASSPKKGTKRKSIEGVPELPESRLFEIRSDLEGVVQRNWDSGMREIFISNEYHIQHRDERVEFVCFCNRPLVLNLKKNRHDFNFSNVKRHFERYHGGVSKPSQVHALLNAMHEENGQIQTEETCH